MKCVSVKPLLTFIIHGLNLGVLSTWSNWQWMYLKYLKYLFHSFLNTLLENWRKLLPARNPSIEISTGKMALHTAHSTLHAAHCKLHTAHCKLHTAHGTRHTAHCTPHTENCTLKTAHWKLKTAIPRQELRLEPRGSGLKNEATLGSLGVQTGALLYFKVGSGMGCGTHSTNSDNKVYAKPFLLLLRL